MCVGHAAAALGAIVALAAPRLSWEIIRCTAGHDLKQHAIPKQSSHCRLRRRRRKSHCAFIPLLCPGP